MSSGLTGRQRVVLALVCAVAVSTIYGIQPVLETAGEDLGLRKEHWGGWSPPARSAISRGWCCWSRSVTCSTAAGSSRCTCCSLR